MTLWSDFALALQRMRAQAQDAPEPVEPPRPQGTARQVGGLPPRTTPGPGDGIEDAIRRARNKTRRLT